MLRGRIPAKIDDKGRLKVPSAFRAHIEAEYGPALFLTSLSPTGEFVRLYPLAVWERIEQKLATLPQLSQARKAFEMTTSYWGHMAEFDTQGRVVIPPALRDAAAALADVDVLGLQTSIEVWNADRLRAKVESHGLNDTFLDELAALGI
ncbi:MAG: division/cell wall cluster transcriptional repressor MraZ [Acidobacteria bacterium]|nr:division/cell wall cluster transcriptional repressor MraZ [Acidobacteriota bacterium]